MWTDRYNQSNQSITCAPLWLNDMLVMEDSGSPLTHPAPVTSQRYGGDGDEEHHGDAGVQRGVRRSVHLNLHHFPNESLKTETTKKGNHFLNVWDFGLAFLQKALSFLGQKLLSIFLKNRTAMSTLIC